MLKPKDLRYDQKVNLLIGGLFAILLGILLTVYLYVNASPNIQLSQTINAGTLATDVLDASRVSVANPTATFGAATFSFDCQTTTGTLGSGSQRLYVMNPSAAANGWTLTIAATSGATSNWTDGSSGTYDFNDSGGSGCTDGGDADSLAGQLTVNANAGTLTADCASCVTTNISKGTSTPFVQASTDSITLLTAASNSDDIGRWYLTGVGLSQTVPAEQPPATYTISLTITVTAS